MNCTINWIMGEKMREEFIFLKDYAERAKPVCACAICGSAIFCGEVIYTNLQNNEVVGCENCIEKIFK